MIDIHNHIIPRLDDGPSTLEESLEMARIAVNDGIKTIVATPHNNGLYQNGVEKITKEVEQFNLSLKQEGIPLKVLPGADIHIEFSLLKDIKEKKAMTVNNNMRYIMLELPTFGMPQHLSEFIWELRVSGITPIFTHPERNETIQAGINILYDFIMQGGHSQITAMSLTGEFGKKAQKCAVSLLRYNLAHVIATDAHSVKRRPPVLSAGLKIAAKTVGHEHALRMVNEIPDKIIKGEEFLIIEPLREKKRFFSLRSSILKRGNYSGRKEARLII